MANKKYTQFPDVVDQTGMILLLSDPVTGALYKIDQSLIGGGGGGGNGAPNLILLCNAAPSGILADAASFLAALQLATENSICVINSYTIINYSGTYIINISISNFFIWPDNIFQNDTQLTGIYAMGITQSIGNHSFDNSILSFCNFNGIANVGDSAFLNSASLGIVYLPQWQGIYDAGNVFNGCTSLTDLTALTTCASITAIETANSFTAKILANISGGSTPNLQQVTDVGQATTNSISAIQFTAEVVGDTSIAILQTQIGFSGLLQLSNPLAVFGVINASLITANVALALPNNNGTFALSVNGNAADNAGNVVSLQNLQSVTDAGNTTTDAMNFAGGVVDEDFHAIAPPTGTIIMGVSGSDGVAKGIAMEYNPPSAAPFDGGYLNVSNGVGIVGRLFCSNLTASRDWQFPDKSGILALVNTADNFANDGAAATGGIPIGGLYHTSGTVKIRLT